MSISEAGAWGGRGWDLVSGIEFEVLGEHWILGLVDMAAVNAAPIRNLSCISAIGENSIRPERQAINCLRDKRQKGLSRGRMRVLRARNGRFWTSSRQSSGSSWRWRIRMERAGTSKTESDNCIQETHVEDPRPPFNLDLAVLLAGFAFESYNAPRVNWQLPYSEINLSFKLLILIKFRVCTVSNIQCHVLVANWEKLILLIPAKSENLDQFIILKNSETQTDDY